MHLPVLVAALATTTAASLLVTNLALADGVAAANQPPRAVDDTGTVVVGGTVDLDVLANDLDPEGSALTLDAITTPTAGNASIQGSLIRFAAPPTPGVVTFSYTVSDGYRTADATVMLQVTSAAGAAAVAQDDTATTMSGRAVRIDVVANDSDADGDALTVSLATAPSHGDAAVIGNAIRYTSVAGFVGTDTLDYQVDDGHGQSARAAVRVIVTPLRIVTIQVPRRVVALHRAVAEVSVTQSAGPPSGVVVQRRVDGTWRAWRRGQLNSDSELRLSWHSDRPGPMRLRAVASWGEDRVVSRVASTRIVVRFDPVVTKVTRDDVRLTWHAGCPVGPDQLRMITMNHWDYHRRIQRGRLVGAVWAVRAYLTVFRVALRTHFPIKKLYPADRYLGDDKRAMAAGDTSAFNCRHVTGNPYRISQHSWGDAIDINTFENPYGTSSRVYPGAAANRYFWHRGAHLRDPGVMTRRSSIARALWRQGWSWGARWSPADYQHWSRNGG